MKKIIMILMIIFIMIITIYSHAASGLCQKLSLADQNTLYLYSSDADVAFCLGRACANSLYYKYLSEGWTWDISKVNHIYNGKVELNIYSKFVNGVTIYRTTVSEEDPPTGLIISEGCNIELDTFNKIISLIIGSVCIGVFAIGWKVGLS